MGLARSRTGIRITSRLPRPLPAGDLVISGCRRRRARSQRLRGRVRSGDRQRSVAILDACPSAASRVPKPGRARRSSTAARRHGSPAATIRNSTWSIGRPATRAEEYNGDNAAGRQSLLRLHPGARSQDRQAEVALPIHAARSLGLGFHGDLGAGQCGLAGAPAQADAACRSQRLLLRVRPRRTASCCSPSSSSRT